LGWLECLVMIKMKQIQEKLLAHSMSLSLSLCYNYIN